MLNVPNFESPPLFQAQSLWENTDILALGAGIAQSAGVISGCQVTPSSGMVVNVSGGQLLTGGTVVSSPAGSVTLAPASSTDRKDIIVCDLGGGIPAKVTGTPCGVANWNSSSPTNPPVMPSIPPGKVLVGAIYVTGGTTVITSQDILDKTVIVPAPTSLSFTPAVDGAFSPLSRLVTSPMRHFASTTLIVPAAGQELTLFQVGSGSGIVRDFHINLGATQANVLSRLRIYTDGNATPDVDVDLGTLFLQNFDGLTGYQDTRRTVGQYSGVLSSNVPKTITHNLGVTPTQVFISPLADVGTGGRFYVVGKTSTTFQLLWISGSAYNGAIDWEVIADVGGFTASTEHISIQATGYATEPASPQSFGPQFIVGNVRYPVPFSNGVKFTLYNPPGSPAGGDCWFECAYQNNVVAPYRLKGVRVDPVSIPAAAAGPPPTNVTSNVWTISDRGTLVYCALSQSSGLPPGAFNDLFLERPVSFFVDGGFPVTQLASTYTPASGILIAISVAPMPMALPVNTFLTMPNGDLVALETACNVGDTTLSIGGARATITGITPGAPCVLTVAGHGLTTGQAVGVYGATGMIPGPSGLTVNGQWTVTVIDANNFSLNNSNASGTWTGGGVLSYDPYNIGLQPTSNWVSGTEIVMGDRAAFGTEDFFETGWYGMNRSFFGEPAAIFTGAAGPTSSFNGAVDYLMLTGGIPFTQKLVLQLSQKNPNPPATLQNNVTLQAVALYYAPH